MVYRNATEQLQATDSAVYFERGANYLPGTIGWIAGIIHGVRRGNKFWGIVGWSIVGSVAGNAVGYVLWKSKKQRETRILSQAVVDGE